MMNSIISDICVVGSELEGNCKGNSIRINIKRNIILLPNYNNKNCVLEGFAKCKINQKVKLSQEDYIECLQIIRKLGYQPQESIGYEIKGTEISCEFDRQQIPSRNLVILKSKIALGILNRTFSKGGFYEITKSYTKTQNYN